jgi:hypothetical protein
MRSRKLNCHCQRYEISGALIPHSAPYSLKNLQAMPLATFGIASSTLELENGIVFLKTNKNKSYLRPTRYNATILRLYLSFLRQIHKIS